MTYLLHQLTPSEVTDVKTFASFANQTIGTSFPRNQREWGQAGKHCSTFFAENPHADWMTLVNTVAWAKAKRRRLATVTALVNSVRWAFADGALPELDPTKRRVVDEYTEEAIWKALDTETDPCWRNMLICANGIENRRLVLHAWRDRQGRGRAQL